MIYRKQNLSLASAIMPAVATGLCIYRIAHGNLAPGGTARYGWLAVIFGFLTLVVLAAYFIGNPQKGAKRITKLNQNLYGSEHKREIVDESAIATGGLDVSFYDSSTKAITALGFRKLSDFVDLTANGALPVYAIVRCFVSNDGAIMGSMFDVRCRTWMRLLQLLRVIPRPLRAVDFETELSDESFVCTTAAPMAGKSAEVPGILRKPFAAGTPIHELFKAHRDHLRSVLAAKGETVRPVIIRTSTDFFAAQDRMQTIKSRFRMSAAYDPAAEMERIAGKPLSEEQREAADEARRLHLEAIEKHENPVVDR